MAHTAAKSSSKRIPVEGENPPFHGRKMAHTVRRYRGDRCNLCSFELPAPLIFPLLAEEKKYIFLSKSECIFLKISCPGLRLGLCLCPRLDPPPGSAPGSCVCHFNYSRSQAGSASRSSLITVSQLLTSPKAPEKRLPQLARLSLPYPLPAKPTQAHNALHIAPVRCLRPGQKRTESMPAKRLTSL